MDCARHVPANHGHTATSGADLEFLRHPQQAPGHTKLKVPATRTIPSPAFRDIPAIRSGLTMLVWK